MDVASVTGGLSQAWLLGVGWGSYTEAFVRWAWDEGHVLSWERPQPFASPALPQVRISAQAFNPGLLCVACGSYRRGKATCGDVDVLITHPDGRSHQGIFSRLLDSLRQQGIHSVFGWAG